eukprot:IDg6030t1
MFDVPRYSSVLADRIRKLAGPHAVYHVVLSHRDDVAAHDRWASALGATRIIHQTEANSAQRTDECETQLVDSDFPHLLVEGVSLFHVPGHTRGSVAMLHEASASLFTGDHIMYSGTRGAILPSSTYCFYSWERQTRSVRELGDLPFLHAWPAHGGHFHFGDAAERHAVIESVADSMENIPVSARW